MKKTPRKRLKPKKRSITATKAELEALQKEEVIRLYGKDCYTCHQKDLEGVNCQLGHVPWPRSDLGPMAKFDTRYTRIQCFRCNINLGGNGAVALQRMIDEGIDVKALRAESDAQKNLTVPDSWYVEQIETRKMLLK